MSGVCGLQQLTLSMAPSGESHSVLFLVFSARRVCIARTMPWQDVCLSITPSVCLSVRLSHAGILSKRLYISKLFHHRLAPPFYSFSTPNGMVTFRRRPHNGGVECRGYEKSRFSTNISLYLGNDVRQSHSYYRRRIGNRTKAFEWYQFK